MPDIEVALGARRYSIHLQHGLLDSRQLAQTLGSKPVLIVSDSHVAPLYAARLKQAIGRSECPVWVLPAGEQEKTLARYCELLNTMAEHNLTRDSVILALGGGVIGDLAGFAAASYMRGIALLQIPTTLLAMVDSSVGGKTAVDLPAGKNLAGAFHQPSAVWIDPGVLHTLPEREYRAGLAEIVKYGAIADPEFFAWLEHNADALLQHQPEALLYAIEHSCRQKAGIVARDETEQGERALLNFGHTFGHALEVLMGFGTLVHGEAVAIGMVLAADFSAGQGLASEADGQRLRRLLQTFGLPVTLPGGLDPADILSRMRLDKKARSNHIRLILWRGIGQAFLAEQTDELALTQFLEARA